MRRVFLFDLLIIRLEHVVSCKFFLGGFAFYLLSILFELLRMVINQVVKSIHDFGTKMRTYSDTA